MRAHTSGKALNRGTAVAAGTALMMVVAGIGTASATPAVPTSTTFTTTSPGISTMSGTLYTVPPCVDAIQAQLIGGGGGGGGAGGGSGAIVTTTFAVQPSEVLLIGIGGGGSAGGSNTYYGGGGGGGSSVIAEENDGEPIAVAGGGGGASGSQSKGASAGGNAGQDTGSGQPGFGGTGYSGGAGGVGFNADAIYGGPPADDSGNGGSVDAGNDGDTAGAGGSQNNSGQDSADSSWGFGGHMIATSQTAVSGTFAVGSGGGGGGGVGAGNGGIAGGGGGAGNGGPGSEAPGGGGGAGWGGGAGGSGADFWSGYAYTGGGAGGSMGPVGSQTSYATASTGAGTGGSAGYAGNNGSVTITTVPTAGCNVGGKSAGVRVASGSVFANMTRATKAKVRGHMLTLNMDWSRISKKAGKRVRHGAIHLADLRATVKLGHHSYVLPISRGSLPVSTSVNKAKRKHKLVIQGSLTKKIKKFSARGGTPVVKVRTREAVDLNGNRNALDSALTSHSRTAIILG